MVMQDPNVEFAIPDYIGKIADGPSSVNHIIHHSLAIEPNDPFYFGQWAFNDNANAKMHFPSAWDLSKGNSDIVIAVLDTGLDITHPDIKGKNTGTGYNFIENNSEIQDDNALFGHGTNVSGIAAASTHNGIGVAGACWNCKIMPIKVCDYKGDCPNSAVQQGIIWAVNYGAKIINMSLGGPTSEFGRLAWEDAINYAYNEGILLVSSAGNKNEDLRYS